MLHNFLEEVSIPWPGWGEEVTWFVFRDDGELGFGVGVGGRCLAFFGSKHCLGFGPY